MNSQQDYQLRREQVMQFVGKSGAILLQAAPIALRNHYHEYTYRQNSDFWYLTGFNEPEAILVLLPERPAGEFILFCRERNPEQETWDGVRAGIDGAIKQFGANESYPITEIEKILPDILENRDSIYYPMGSSMSFDRMILKTLKKMREKIRSGIIFPTQLKDIRPQLHEQRLVKTADEINLMRTAAKISALGHIQAMKSCHPDLFEYQLEAELTYAFQHSGGRHHAYPPIVGSGKNSCTLHYVTNHCKIKSGDLVLIDAACEFNNYAADITRTFPANGKFTAEQRAVYEIVLAAQLAGISAIKPKANWDDIELNIIRILTQGLIDLKLLSGSVDDLIEQGEYKKFYMHRAGHWLGLDVHDAGNYRNKNGWIELSPGQVRTMEPGIYISEKLTDIDKRWHNIGVRIEDDILVTSSGNEVLSAEAPKAVNEIEELMKK